MVLRSISGANLNVTATARAIFRVLFQPLHTEGLLYSTLDHLLPKTLLQELFVLLRASQVLFLQVMELL